MAELDKTYRPSDVEGPVYERWLAADVFAPDGAGSTADPALPPFTIIQPPPNITGSLHLGHAQRTAVEDLMIRHARMRGHRALFLPGLDHASIAAQFVLDGILAEEGESRQSLGRERYLERMRAFVSTTREVMLAQQRRVGASADWGRLRFTMDDGSAKAVRVAFERLYNADLVYRTEALVNWCPGCRTSVSDLEVVSTPETGRLWSVRYHLIDPATGEPDPERDDHGRDHAARDDPRRHRGRGASRRSALHGPGRPDGPDPVRRPRRPGHRRRRRRARIRDGGREDHPGPRSRRPSDRSPPRPGRTDHPRRRRDHRQHRHPLRRDGPLRRPRRDRRRSRRTWRPRLRGAARDGHRTLPAKRRCRRAAAEDAVVRADGAARCAGARGDTVRTDANPAGPVREDLGALAHQHPGLERLAPALVGSPDPGLVLPRRPRDGLVGGGRPGCVCGLRPTGGGRSSRTRTSSIRGSARVCGRSRRSGGRTTRRIWRPTTRRR